VSLSFLGGKRGRDVIRDTVEQNLLSLGVGEKEAKELALKKTTPAEEKLITAINDGFNNAIVAQDFLTKIIQDKQLKVLEDIKENTKGLKVLFEKNLISVERTQKETDAKGLITQIGDLGRQKGVFNQITELIGGDADKFHNIRKALPHIGEFKNKQDELTEKRNQLTQLAKFSQFRVNPAGFHLDKSLVNQENDEALLLDLGIKDKLGDTNTTPLGLDRFRQIRKNFGTKFGSQISSEVFNKDFAKQFDADNGTIRQFTETFRARIESLKKGVEKDTESQTDEGQKLLRQTGLKNLNELFEVAEKADKLTKLFESIPNDATFAGLSQINIQAAELARIVEKLRTDITGLNDRESKLGRAGGGGVPGSGSGDTVPAMLTPGEFVIRKDAAQAIGYENLNMMNAQGFAGGGRAERKAAYLANKAALRASFAIPRLARIEKYKKLTQPKKKEYPIDEFGYGFASEGNLSYKDNSTQAQKIAKRDRLYKENVRKNAERIAERDAIPENLGVRAFKNANLNKIEQHENTNNRFVSSVSDLIRSGKIQVNQHSSTAARISSNTSKPHFGDVPTSSLHSGVYKMRGFNGQYYYVGRNSNVYPVNFNTKTGVASSNQEIFQSVNGTRSFQGSFGTGVPIVGPSSLGMAKGGRVKRFASGGAVTSNNSGMSPQAFESLSRFGENINRLSSSLDNFPRTVEMSVRHTVEVIHNGAQMFAALTPSVMQLVEQTTSNAINNMLKQKFPDVGIV
jgi:hypothetical protein